MFNNFTNLNSCIFFSVDDEDSSQQNYGKRGRGGFRGRGGRRGRDRW